MNIFDAYKFFTDLSNTTFIQQYVQFICLLWIDKLAYIQIFIVCLSIKIDLFPDKTN